MDPVGAFDRSRAVENDWRSDPIAVGALQQLMQGNAAVPGASPMPGAAPPGGGGQPTGSPPQQGSPPPQPQQQQVNPLQALWQRLSQTPSQGGGAGGQQPPPQPSAGPAPAPPTNAPIPGAQPMRPAPGPFQQPGQPSQQQQPQQQQPQPQQQQPRPQGWGQQPGQAQGPLDLRSVVQSVLRAAGPNPDPHRVMAAVSKLAPLMNLDSQIQFRQMSEALRMSQQENQLRIAQLNAEQRERTGAAHDVSRETVAGMRPEVKMMHDFYEQNPGATPQQAADYFSGQIKGGQRRADTAASAQEHQDQRNRERIQGQADRQIVAGNIRKDIVETQEQAKTDRQKTAEEGKTTRAELSATTRMAIAKLSNETKQEIADKIEGGRNARAVFSAHARAEIAKMNAEERLNLQQYLEEGRNLRTQMGIRGRSEVAGKRLDQQAFQFGTKTAQRDKQLDQGQQRIDLAKTREARLDRQALVANDMKHQQLEQKQKQLEQQILAQGDRTQLGTWRLIINEMHNRTMELIQLYSANQGVDPDIAKQLKEQADAFHKQQLATMRMKLAIKPGTVENGGIFQGGDPGDDKNWKPVGTPSQAGAPGATQPRGP